MSDPSGRSDAALPPASVDITRLRQVADAAAHTDRARRRIRTAALASAVLLALVAAVVAAVVAVTGSGNERLAVALGGTVLLVGVALIFVVPVQVAGRRSRARIDEVTASIEDATARVVRHLASIAYEVPETVALDWVTSPEPTATVPLVHDSLVAARWWRPAEGDDRVFVEPFLRQDGRDTALPVLPAATE